MNTSSHLNIDAYSGNSKIINNFDHREESEKIDRTIVHKTYDKNVFIGDVTQLKHNLYQCKMIYDQEHDFFFEHHIDHVPGLLILESTRQMGTAICHLYYGIDHNYSFIIDDSVIRFKNFTELNQEVYVRTLIESDTSKASRKVFTGRSYVIQNREIIAEVESTWRCLHKKIWKKLRAK